MQEKLENYLFLMMALKTHIKFMFPKKVSYIDKIFTVNLTFTT